MSNNASNLSTDILEGQHSTNDREAATRELYSAINKMRDAANLRGLCFSDLNALFKAIYDSVGEDSKARHLANIGSYLCTDWAEMCQVTEEDIERALKVIKP